jgi:hypothetical protein
MGRNSESVAHMPAGESKKEKKVLDHMKIEEGEKGGHTVTHHFTSYQHAPEAHVFGKSEGNEMLMHVAKHAHAEHTLEPTGAKEMEVAENSEDKSQESVEA